MADGNIDSVEGISYKIWTKVPLWKTLVMTPLTSSGKENSYIMARGGNILPLLLLASKPHFPQPAVSVSKH